MVAANVPPAEVMEKYRTIAVVGASKNPEKQASTVPRYLKDHGYRIIPVNPTATEIMGEAAYRSLLDIPEAVGRTVEVVEVFRPSDELPQVALQAAEMKKRLGRPFVFWAQQGLENEEAKGILERNGIQYVMDACMRTVHQTLVRKTA
ncbi:MAG: CoA-binding protein [Thaumarchaeota archaeon]|nr:CoA-binding protein [Nitrososphaerota archaeon]